MVALLAGTCLYGQIGSPYPGGGYPPGQYPPGQYPGQYPPGQYPDGGGIGLPIPGRSKKNSQSKKPVISLSGKVTKQDGVKSTLTLDVDDGRNIEIRISGDTKITGESGKLSAADLKLGDEISVQAHTDDKGYFYADTVRLDKSTEVNTISDAKPTAVDPDDHRPVLRRAGTASDHASSDDKSTSAKATNPKPGSSDKADATADKAADKAPAKVATAKKDDEYENGEEHPILPEKGLKASAGDDPDRPIIRRGAPARKASSDDSESEKPTQMASAKIGAPRTITPGESPAVNKDEPEIHTDPAAPAEVHYVTGTGDEVIQKAREAAFDFDKRLPNFVCQQQVTRYQSETKKPNWQAMDVLSYDLVNEDGKEEYKNPKINGKAVKAGADKDSGSWSSGEFGTLLKDVFHPSTAADFRARGQETINHRVAKVYSFTVDKEHSHWRIQGGTQWILPAYKGTIWIDKETYRALRIEMQAVNMPAAFVLDHTESAADYDFVMIKDQKVLLPTHAEVLSCERGSFLCSRNAIDFRNYHAYTGESSISFGNQ